MCGKYRKEMYPTQPVANAQNVTDLYEGCADEK